MRGSLTGGTLALALAALLAGVAAGGRDEKGASLDGEWEVVGMVYKGEEQKIPAAPDRHTWKVKGRELIWRFPRVAGPDGEQPIHGIVLRPGKDPKEIDLSVGQGREPFRGIYKLEGGTLTVVLAQGGQERPEQFDATKDAKLTSYTLRGAKR